MTSTRSGSSSRKRSRSLIAASCGGIRNKLASCSVATAGTEDIQLMPFHGNQTTSSPRSAPRVRIGSAAPSARRYRPRAKNRLRSGTISSQATTASPRRVHARTISRTYRPIPRLSCGRFQASMPTRSDMANILPARGGAPLALERQGADKEARPLCGQRIEHMPQGPIVAHLIVGAKPEAYLACTLESVADVCAHAVVNDTSGAAEHVNGPIIEQSRFAREGRLTLVRSDFSDFATARNACIDATPPAFQNGWALKIDADEVHGPALAAVAAVAARVPDEVDGIDGYIRHFVGSFSWWFELNRTRFLFRLAPQLRWQNAIHEQLAPIGKRVALPAVCFHYGHVITPREEAEKGRLYASLGQPDPAPTDRQLERARPATVWPALLRRAIRFHGDHPRAAQGTIEQLAQERAGLFAEVDALVAQQTPLQRLRNRSRALNAGRLLLWRMLQARVRFGWRDPIVANEAGLTEGVRATG